MLSRIWLIRFFRDEVFYSPNSNKGSSVPEAEGEPEIYCPGCPESGNGGLPGLDDGPHAFSSISLASAIRPARPIFLSRP